MKISSIGIRLLSLLCCFSIDCRADRITLKNGRTIDGTVVGEQKDRIVVSIGSGTMTLTRNQVAKIDKSVRPVGKPAQAPTQGNILTERHAPKQHAELAAQIRELINLRNAAWDGRYMMNVYSKKIFELEKEIAICQEETLKITEQLAVLGKKIEGLNIPTDQPKNKAEFNQYTEAISAQYRLIQQQEALLTRMTPLGRRRSDAEKQIPPLRKKYKTAMEPIPRFQMELNGFSAHYTQYTNSVSMTDLDPSEKAFFNKINHYLEKFAKENATSDIPIRIEGNHSFIQAVINGTTVGEFLLDTGASTMTMTQSFARRAGIDPEKLPKINAILADGSKTSARLGTLNTVSVGPEQVERIEVAILPDFENNGTDGLLGMSFLKHFTVQIDAAAGTVRLTPVAGNR